MAPRLDSTVGDAAAAANCAARVIVSILLWYFSSDIAVYAMGKPFYSYVTIFKCETGTDQTEI